jgi:hypothetical protein
MTWAGVQSPPPNFRSSREVLTNHFQTYRRVCGDRRGEICWPRILGELRVLSGFEIVAKYACTIYSTRVITLKMAFGPGLAKLDKN